MASSTSASRFKFPLDDEDPTDGAHLYVGNCHHGDEMFDNALAHLLQLDKLGVSPDLHEYE